MDIATSWFTLYIGRLCGGGWVLFRWFGRADEMRWQVWA